MRYPVDHSGKQFGDWLVLEQGPMKTGRRVSWVCRCKCGKETAIAACHLVSGASTNCSCDRPERSRSIATKHGKSKSGGIYEIWCRVKARCSNPNLDEYRIYGGRGVRVCARWDNSFEAFAEDMGSRPSRWHSVDRIDGNGNYEPNNCRWATSKEQARHTRRTRYVEVDGQKMSLAEAVERAGSNYSRVLYRLDKMGMDIHEALA